MVKKKGKKKKKHGQTMLHTPVWGLSLSLADAIHPETWPYQGWSHVSSLDDAVHREGTPWILLGLDPGKILANGISKTVKE